MLRVPRHRFVPAPLAPVAYQDTPLPIGFDKTISQPFIAALMTDLLGLRPEEAVLVVAACAAPVPGSGVPPATAPAVCGLGPPSIGRSLAEWRE
jgi:hypothetical protein